MSTSVEKAEKLTVMILRKSVQPLEDLPESLGFLRINEGPFPGQVHTRPYSNAREGTRGYIVAPNVRIPRLSESVTTI